MSRSIRNARLAVLSLTLVAAFGLAAQAAPTPYWFDGYDVSTPTMNINSELGPPRQGGTLGTAYLANTGDPSNDYRHQMGFGPLQLFGDGFPPAPAATMVSPNQSFTGVVGDQVIGRHVSFSLDVGAFVQAPDLVNGSYLTAQFTLGAGTGLRDAQDTLSGSHFGINFVEDTFVGGGLGYFLQFFDGVNAAPVQNVIVNPNGPAPMNVWIDVDDITDGNPWDGVGQTTFTVFIDGVQVGAPQTFGAGGLTSNYMTLAAQRDFVNNGLAGSYFDNLTVYTDIIPEPSTLALAGLGLAGIFLARRRAR